MSQNRLWDYPMGVEQAVERGSKALRCPHCSNSAFSMYLNPNEEKGLWFECQDCENVERFEDIRQSMIHQYFDWDVQEMRERLSDLNSRLQRVEAELFYE